MKNIFHNSAVLEAEKSIIAKYGIPSRALMENAGRKTAEIIWERFLEEKCTRIVILAGKGNNAGDAFVIARHLMIFNDEYDGFAPVTVFMLYPEEELKGDALANYTVLKGLYKGEYYRITDKKADLSAFLDIDSEKILFADAVFGTGYKGKLDSHVRGIFGTVKSGAADKYVIAVDIPSGLDDYTDARDCLVADLTVSMGVRKFNTLFYEGREVSGTINVADIGIRSEEFTEFNKDGIFLFEKEDLHFEETLRNINSHKYNNGKVFVIAGSEGYSGAAYMSAQSALRAGAGAVILGIPASLNPAMEAKTTEVITLPLNGGNFLTSDAFDLISERVKWSDAVLIGPGIGRHPDTADLVLEVIKKHDANFVVDADAVFALKGNTEILKKSKSRIILTPHTGEFANLLGITAEELKKNFARVGLEFASEYGVTLMLKNSPTVTFHEGRVYVNSTGRENLATVGSGDVLSGIAAAYFSQLKDGWAAMSASFVHGWCGDMMYGKFGDSGTLASDLIGLIPAARKELIEGYKKFY